VSAARGSLLFTDVALRFGPHEVLRGVTLDLAPGEVLGLVGRNGAGKTTLIRVATRVLRPERGSVELAGRPLEAWPRRELARAVAVVPQQILVPFPFTVAEVVLMGRAPHQPLLGFDPWLPRHTAWELHLSHWSGELPVLEVYRHFTYGGQFHGLFGRFTYLGAPVHGFSVNKVGNPYDRYARNVYTDTFNSAYGPGWKRESGILTHKGTGTFCHSFVPQRPFPGYPSTATRPAAPGERYRATVMGPGVTPVVQWEGPGLTAADRALQSSTRAIFDRVMAGDRVCASERTAS